MGLGGFTAPTTLVETAVLMLLLCLVALIPVMMALAGSNSAPRPTPCTSAPPATR